MSFAAPNRGINLGSQGVPAFFNYYADVFYGTDYETELQSYYEADDELEVLSGERLDQIEPGLKLPERGNTPRARFRAEFRGKAWRQCCSCNTTRFGRNDVRGG